MELNICTLWGCFFMDIAVFSLIGILGIILSLAIMGLLIYCLIEFIHLSHLTIKALNIYIDNNEKNKVR